MLPRFIVLFLTVLGMGCGAPANKAGKKATTKAAKSKGAQELVLYCGVEPSVAKPLIDLFQRTTKVRVNVKYGKAADLTSELRAQGKDKALADVVWSGEPASLQALLDKSDALLKPLPREILIKVPRELRANDTRWIGVSARVIVPVRSVVLSAELPSDLVDLVAKSTAMKLGYSAGGDLEFFAAWLTKRNAKKADEWIAALARKARFSSESRLLDALTSGKLDLGFVGHDALLRYRRLTESLASARGRRVAVVVKAVPDSLVKLSGVGIMSNAANEENAERFVHFLIGEVAQQYLVSTTLQCPVRDEVAVPKGMISHEALKKIVKRQANKWPGSEECRLAGESLRKVLDPAAAKKTSSPPDKKKKKAKAEAAGAKPKTAAKEKDAAQKSP